MGHSAWLNCRLDVASERPAHLCPLGKSLRFSLHPPLTTTRTVIALASNTRILLDTKYSPVRLTTSGRYRRSNIHPCQSPRIRTPRCYKHGGKASLGGQPHRLRKAHSGTKQLWQPTIAID